MRPVTKPVALGRAVLAKPCSFLSLSGVLAQVLMKCPLTPSGPRAQCDGPGGPLGGVWPTLHLPRQGHELQHLRAWAEG